MVVIFKTLDSEIPGIQTTYSSTPDAGINRKFTFWGIYRLGTTRHKDIYIWSHYVRILEMTQIPGDVQTQELRPVLDSKTDFFGFYISGRHICGDDFC